MNGERSTTNTSLGYRCAWLRSFSQSPKDKQNQQRYNNCGTHMATWYRWRTISTFVTPTCYCAYVPLCALLYAISLREFFFFFSKPWCQWIMSKPVISHHCILGSASTMCWTQTSSKPYKTSLPIQAWSQFICYEPSLSFPLKNLRMPEVTTHGQIQSTWLEKIAMYWESILNFASTCF